VGAVRQLLLSVARSLLFILPDCLKGALLRREQEFGQRFVAQGGVDEEDDKQRKYDGGNVNQASQGFPASTSRIIKDWFSHGG